MANPLERKETVINSLTMRVLLEMLEEQNANIIFLNLEDSVVGYGDVEIYHNNKHFLIKERAKNCWTSEYVITLIE